MPLSVKTRRPTRDDLERLNRIAHQTSGEHPAPTMKSVIADVLPVIAAYKQNGHDWATIAKHLAGQGLLYHQDDDDDGAQHPEDGAAADAGAADAAGAAADNEAGRRPVKTSTLRATAWQVNRERDQPYDLGG